MSADINKESLRQLDTKQLNKHLVKQMRMLQWHKRSCQ